MSKFSVSSPHTRVSPAQLKRVRALWRRESSSADIVLEGPHLLYEALDSSLPISAVWHTAEAARREGSALTRALDRAAALGAALQRVDETTLASMSPAKTPSGVVAIARRPEHQMRDLFGGPRTPLVVVGLDIQDPGNAGAIVRVAEAAGSTGVWLSAASADPFSWRALRGSMGSAFRLPVLRCASTSDILSACAARHLRVVAADGGAPATMYDVDFRMPTAIFLGSEGAGLPHELRAASSTLVAIPMSSGVSSLNVATAAAVLLYEALRQRRDGDKR